MPVERLADLLREHAHVPAGLLFPFHHPHLPVQLARLVHQEVFPDLDPEELRYEREQGDGRGEGDECSEELGDGEGEHEVEGVRLVGEDGDEVREAAEHDEGAELQHDPFEGEEVGAGGEVEQLERDGEVGRGDEEVADLLALQDVVGAGEGAVVGVVAAAAVAEVDGRRRRREEEQGGEEQEDPHRGDGDGDPAAQQRRSHHHRLYHQPGFIHSDDAHFWRRHGFHAAHADAPAAFIRCRQLVNMTDFFQLIIKLRHKSRSGKRQNRCLWAAGRLSHHL